MTPIRKRQRARYIYIQITKNCETIIYTKIHTLFKKQDNFRYVLIHKNQNTIRYVFFHANYEVGIFMNAK